MGIDFLDVSLRIEKEFNVQVSHDDWTTLSEGRRPRDVSAGDLFDLIRRTCRFCGYDLRGHADAGICPECGKAFDFSERTQDAEWETLQGLLADAMKAERAKILRDTLLVRDLGMT